jgi:hypothetical protein
VKREVIHLVQRSVPGFTHCTDKLLTDLARPPWHKNIQASLGQIVNQNQKPDGVTFSRDGLTDEIQVVLFQLLICDNAISEMTKLIAASTLHFVVHVVPQLDSLTRLRPVCFPPDVFRHDQ